MSDVGCRISGDLEPGASSGTTSRISRHPTSEIPSLNVLLNDLINDPIFLGLFGDHDVVPLHVLLDPIEGLAGVTNQDVAGDLAHAQDLARLDVDVGGLAG